MTVLRTHDVGQEQIVPGIPDDSHA
jgi:hypothetical protein